jgi:hypothetical protein
MAEVIEAEELIWKKTGIVPGTEKGPVKELGSGYPQWRGTATGKITFLRVCFNDSWGAPYDAIDTEVVIKHSAEPDLAFGFYLRPSKAGENLSANLAMLSTLRDSMVHNIPVSIGYWVRWILIPPFPPERWGESQNCLMERVNLMPNP